MQYAIGIERKGFYLAQRADKADLFTFEEVEAIHAFLTTNKDAVDVVELGWLYGEEKFTVLYFSNDEVGEYLLRRIVEKVGIHNFDLSENIKYSQLTVNAYYALRVVFLLHIINITNEHFFKVNNNAYNVGRVLIHMAEEVLNKKNIGVNNDE